MLLIYYMIMDFEETL